MPSRDSSAKGLDIANRIEIVFGDAPLHHLDERIRYALRIGALDKMKSDLSSLTAELRAASLLIRCAFA
jgi:hypothetical protein